MQAVINLSILINLSIIVGLLFGPAILSFLFLIFFVWF
jgi:hypothetical protein